MKRPVIFTALVLSLVASSSVLAAQNESASIQTERFVDEVVITISSDKGQFQIYSLKNAELALDETRARMMNNLSTQTTDLMADAS